MKKLILLLVVLLVTPLCVTSQDIDNVDYISPFNDGLAAIEKNDKWAFINASAEIVIDYRDDLVLSTFGEKSYPIFNSGRCLIVKKEEGISYFGYINKEGKTVIEPQFLNATNFNDGLAIVLKLHKNLLGQNDVLDKEMIDYSYTENAINPNGKVEHYLSDKPTHITLSKDFAGVPPEIKVKFISDKLIAIKNNNNNWTIRKIDDSN